MSKLFVAAASAAASICVMAPSAASAQQMAPGAELHGQQVQVLTANGETNMLTFQPDGTLSISSTNGQSAMGQWAAQNGSLCITHASRRECWPYRSAFQAQQPLTLVSDCGASSQWTALGTNMPMQPVQRRAGERG